jgi:starch synthase
VPVARRTGGLADTVIDDDEAPGGGNGFSFTAYKPEAMLEALERAAAAFKDRRRWRGIIGRGMRADHSWKASAARYLELYRQALARRARMALSAATA